MNNFKKFLESKKQLYVVKDKKGKIVTEPMSTEKALTAYDSLGGRAKGYEVVKPKDK